MGADELGRQQLRGPALDRLALQRVVAVRCPDPVRTGESAEVDASATAGARLDLGTSGWGGAPRRLDDGWITELGPSGDRQPGRPATLVAVRPERAGFIGIKITSDELIGMLVDLTAAPLTTHRTPLRSRDVGTVVRAVARLVGALSGRPGKGEGESGPAVHGIGVTVSGAVDGPRGTVRYSPFLDWHGVRLAALVEEATGIPAVIDNDVRALTVAEQWGFGDGVGLSSFALVTVGAGVGCGMSVHGRVVSALFSYSYGERTCSAE